MYQNRPGVDCAKCGKRSAPFPARASGVLIEEDDVAGPERFGLRVHRDQVPVVQVDGGVVGMADAAFDMAVLQMVLHHAEDPAQVLMEAARVLRPGGILLVVDLARHSRTDITARFAHRHPGFSDTDMTKLLRGAGLRPTAVHRIDGALQMRLWPALAPLATARRVDARADLSLA